MNKLVLVLLFISNALVAQTLSVSEGTSISFHDDAEVSIQEMDLKVDGLLLQESGSLQMSSLERDTEILGNGNMSFYNLEINVPKRLYINTSVEIKNTIELLSGNVDILDNDLYLSTNESRIINETIDRRITSSENGEVVKNTTSVISKNENVGNLGLIFNEFTNPGFLEIRRGHKAVEVPFGESITRYYKINTQKRTQDKVNMDIKFFKDEVLVNDSNLEKTVWVNNSGEWNRTKSKPRLYFNKDEYVTEAEIDIYNSIVTVGLYRKLIEVELIPTVFTPNGDQMNDIFKIPGIEKLSNAEVSIYSQAGSFIYKSDNYTQEPWDGTLNGQSLPFGTYHYVIQDKKNPRAKIDGQVSIIK